AYMDSVIELLEGAPPAESFDGPTLRILLDDTRSVGRAAAMQEWSDQHRSMSRAVTTAFHRRLAALGPVGDALVRAWNWGERGSVRKADREALAESATVVRAALARVGGDRRRLDELLERMARDAEGLPSGSRR